MGPVPLATSLSAYSTTTMAPSTSMPTARISPNMTMLLIDRPSACMSAKDSRNEHGMAIPTSRAERKPSAANTTIMTKMIAVATEPSSWPTMERTSVDWSMEMSTETAVRSGSGHLASSRSTISRAPSTVWMMFSPMRLEICNEIEPWPL